MYFCTVLNNPARVQVPVIGHVTRLPGVWAPPSGIKIVTSFSDGTKITGMVGVQDI